MSSSAATPKEVVLVMDDEPQYLDWLLEYLGKRGLDIVTATNLTDAFAALEKCSYRSILADLSIPVSEELTAKLKKQGEVYLKFPGLFLAHMARNKGYRGRQVIVYSVHDDPSVRDVASMIGVRYITKGRPKILKAELDDIFSYDPSKKSG